MKMQKRKAALTAGVVTASAAFLCSCGAVPALYGPPPETPPAETPFHEENNIPEALYGPPEMLTPEFYAEFNVPADLYGPPMPYEENENGTEPYAETPEAESEEAADTAG